MTLMSYQQRLRNRLAPPTHASTRAACADIGAEADAELATLRAQLAAAEERSAFYRSNCLDAQEACAVLQESLAEVTAQRDALLETMTKARTALHRARDGYASEAVTGLPVLAPWRTETLEKVVAAIAAIDAARTAT